MTGPPVFPLRPAPARTGDRRLAGWRANVGAGVAVDSRSGVPPGTHASLVVLSWNVWVGRGRVTQLVERVRNGEFKHAGAEPELPLVLLLQEALRSGEAVPERSNGWAPRERIYRAGTRDDIVEAADRLGLWLIT